MIARDRPHPLLIVLAVVCAALVVAGVSVEQLKGDGHSITDHSGTLHWTPAGENPDPALASRFWTLAYPAAYARRVEPGVGVYVKEKRIGFVHASKVDDGTVWVYMWIAPEYEGIAEDITESEPIEAPGGPRVEIYKYSSVPPASTTPA